MLLKTHRGCHHLSLASFLLVWWSRRCPLCSSRWLLIFPRWRFRWWCHYLIYSDIPSEGHTVRKELKDGVSCITGVHGGKRGEPWVQAQKWLKAMKSRSQGKGSRWWKSPLSLMINKAWAESRVEADAQNYSARAEKRSLNHLCGCPI